MTLSRFRTGLGCKSTQEAVLHGSVTAKLLQEADEDLRYTGLQRTHSGYSYLAEGLKTAK